MSHKHSNNFLRSMIRTREQQPEMRYTKEGVQILCPFCKPAHPLIPGQPSSCGTIIKLTALQEVIPTRIVRMNHLVCLKCHQGGGEMVKYMNGYVHLVECDPKTRLLPEIPDYNFLAGWVIKLPEKLRRRVEKVTGLAQQVREIDQDGKQTGKILGHFFMPRQSMDLKTSTATAKE